MKQTQSILGKFLKSRGITAELIYSEWNETLYHVEINDEKYFELWFDTDVHCRLLYGNNKRAHDCGKRQHGLQNVYSELKFELNNA